LATTKTAALTLAIALSAAASCVSAQTPSPKTSQEPAAPAPQTPVAPANPFPPVNPHNFTADTPTVDEVNAFLKALWGFDQFRVWQVAGIFKTSAPGIAKIVVLAADTRQPGRAVPTIFFTTPDGHHAIADNVMDFGPKPFAENRKTLQDRATGPARGAKSNDLLLVEFGDLQSPASKDAQEKIDSLAQDFPQARIVFEDVAQASHHYDLQAAEYGVCVRKAKGDAAFFTYAQAVFAKQAGLTPDSAEATLKAAAASAGADPAAVAACAATPDAKADVEASTKLAEDIGAGQIPSIAVNGHILPLEQVPYETLKQIVAFQAGQDGITVHIQPTLTELK
jgi:protein-disulfide isomerase